MTCVSEIWLTPRSSEWRRNFILVIKRSICIEIRQSLRCRLLIYRRIVILLRFILLFIFFLQVLWICIHTVIFRIHINIGRGDLFLNSAILEGLIWLLESVDAIYRFIKLSTVKETFTIKLSLTAIILNQYFSSLVTFRCFINPSCWMQVWCLKLL